MVKKKQTPVVYKREKDKIEIIGNSDDVKPMIWYDLLLDRLLQILRLFFFFWLWRLFG